jgi:phage repressor protein C with HTH and peptisase S24 domain
MTNKLVIGFGDRIKSLIPKGESQSDFANKIGVSIAGFRNWLDESSEPKIAALARIAELTGADLNWLIMGEPGKGEGKGSEFAMVKELDVLASAGAGALNQESQTGLVSFRRDWLRERGINPNAATVISAWGDSMEPTIRSGDTLLVDNSIDRIRDEGIYVLVVGGLTIVKRLMVAANGDLRLSSDNPQFGSEIIKKQDLSDLHVAGRVMWFGRTI